MQEKSEMHELALGWVDFGCAVFPCRNADEVDEDHANGGFREYKEKTPLITSGLNGASRSEKIVNRWWTKFPDAIPGIPTGKDAGFWILDVDVPSDRHAKDGRIWMEEMTAIHGDLPETKIVQTANGGYQYFFKHVDGVKNRSGTGKEGELGHGIDVRGDGGYIIAPGSIMKDGRYYEWLNNDAPVAEAPKWLLDLVIGKTYAPKKADVAGSNSNGDQARAYGLSTLQAEADVLAAETEGGRGAAANRAAFNCGGLVEHCNISASEIEAALYDACVANGLVQKDGANKVLRDLKRQIASGMSKPRSAPELKKRDRGNERSVTVSGLNKIAQKAKERASRPDWDQSERDSYSSAVEEDDEDEARLKITPWDYSYSSEDLEMRDAIMPPHLTRRQVGLTLAAGGVGKTTNSAVEILSLVTGKDLLGYKPSRKYRVWWFNLEDPRDELDKKIWGVINYYKLDLPTIQQGLFVDSGREQDLRVALATKNDPAEIDEEIVGLMIEYIERNEIDVMVIDPFVSAHGVNENDNGAIDRVAKILNQVAEHGNCAIEIVHHIKKVDENKKRATSDDGRGASSLASAARSIRVFNKMSEEEAKRFDIHPNDRHSYFVMNYEKRTYGKMQAQDIWRKLEGQSLFNSKSNRVPHESTGVATPWEPPQEKRLEEVMTGKERAMILTNCANQTWNYDVRAASWVGEMIADVMGKNVDDDRNMLKSLIDKMIREGLLEKSTENVPGRAKPQVIVRPKKEK